MMDLQSTLIAILVLLVASRVAAEVSERVKQPSILAEIALGIALGPSALGLVSSTEIVQLLAEIGVILLLFEVGRQMSVKELRHAGPAALRVAVLGIAAPMLLAYPILRALGVDGTAALFLAAGITATSVGITARVFADLRSLATPEGRIVMGAGLADDIIGLLVLTVVASVAAGERVTAASVGLAAALSVGFLVVAVLAGVVLIPRLLDALSRRARTDGTLMAAGVALAFGLAFASSAAGLAPIIGAFVAGLAVGRSDSAPELHRRLTPLGHFFIPIFFINIGLSSDVGVFARADVLGIAAALTACAIVGKLVSGLGAKRGSADRILIGVAMIPRGEVGLIFASLGLSSGVLDARLYGVLLAVVLATTIITPPWMRLRIQGRRRAVRQREVPTDTAPAGGWLLVSEELVDLAETPPPALAGVVGLQAAMLCSTRNPGPRLIEWLVAATDGQPADHWDQPTRDAFFHVLCEGSDRSWRFLEAGGLIEWLLPEVASAASQRERDSHMLDVQSPAGFWLLAQLRIAVGMGDPAAHAWEIAGRDTLTLAALAQDAFATSRDPAMSARSLATKIGLPHGAALECGFLVRERNVLRAAAGRSDLDEDVTLELAAFLQTKERAAALYLLTLAGGGFADWERARLESLYALVLDALAQPDITGSAATHIAQRRTEGVAAILNVPPEQCRQDIMQMPRQYLLAHDEATIARHLHMVEAPLTRFQSRLEADFEGQDRWIVHVALRDRRGALAVVAGALASCGASVVGAHIATWRNGLALDVFRVEASSGTDWDAARRRIDASLTAGPSDTPVQSVEGEVTIDNDASPWHSIVEVHATDRAGLLTRVASALSAARLQIHQAVIATVDGKAVDTFWVTGGGGGKLNTSDERALRNAFAGRAPKRFRFPGRRLRALDHLPS